MSQSLASQPQQQSSQPTMVSKTLAETGQVTLQDSAQKSNAPAHLIAQQWSEPPAASRFSTGAGAPSLDANNNSHMFPACTRQQPFIPAQMSDLGVKKHQPRHQVEH